MAARKKQSTQFLNKDFLIALVVLGVVVYLFYIFLSTKINDTFDQITQQSSQTQVIQKVPTKAPIKANR